MAQANSRTRIRKCQQPNFHRESMDYKNIEMARHLRERHRYDEAEAALLSYLASNPEDAVAHCELAITRMSMEGRERDALHAIEDAIGLNPDNGWMVAVKAFILVDNEKYDKALKVSNEAIAMDPDCVLAWMAQARAYGGKEQWKSAEQSVRQALNLDPDDQQANNLLSLYLRLQGRTDEADYYTETMLGRDAEDHVALTNAGWTRLHGGKSKEAEELFLEALRIEPNSEYARNGIREAYKARSFFYSLYLKWAFFMQRFAGGTQAMIVIGLFLGFRFLRTWLEMVHPVLGLSVLVIYMVFVFWVWMASGLGHFILLTDRKARHSLNTPERWDGILVGGFFVTGLLTLAVGAVTNTAWMITIGAGFLSTAVPNSLVSLNGSRAGQIVFGILAALCMILSVLGAVVQISQPDQSFSIEYIAPSLLLAMLTTWLGNLPSLRD